jgi:hypothetical protein
MHPGTHRIAAMILERPVVTPEELERCTGWKLEPEGACKGDRCVPLPRREDGTLEARVLSERLGMALVHDVEHDLWALGPEVTEHALAGARLPSITLPDRSGTPFSLDSLRGTKVLLVAWASW